MIFHKSDVALLVHPLVCVRAEAMHVPKPIRSTSVRKEDGHLVKGFRAVAPKVPCRVRIMQIGLWVSLLAVDKVRELDRILDKEDRGVVSNHVKISFFSIEL